MLSVKNISKSYVGHKALDNVSLEIKKSSIFGLLGPNGAGKTSLIRVINQIINQDEGDILIDGRNITYEDVRKIGYMPEERGLYKKMKVGDFLLFMGKLKGLNRNQCIESAADWFEMLEVSNWWKKNIEDLSKGMSQKVQFISTVLHSPDLIILDEPFSGFDPINANLVKNNLLRLRDEGKTIIFSTHRMESVDEICDHLAMINNSKKILDGNTEQIKMDSKSNNYMITHNNVLIENKNIFDLVTSTKITDNIFESEVTLKKGKKSRDLIVDVSGKNNIISFNQRIPNMNDIFIMKVKEEEKNG
mgnify:CR=1 FL=1